MSLSLPLIDSIWKQAEQVVEASLKLLQPQRNVSNRTRQLKVYAQSLDIQSRMWYLRGQSEVALKSSQQATNIYKQLEDKEGIVGSQINQAQALQVLGFYQQAQTTLQEVKQTLAQISNFSIQAKGLIGLGNVLRAVGELRESQQTLKKSLEVVEKLPSSQTKAEIKSTALLSLGNTIRARGNLERDRLATNEYNYMPWRCVDKLIPDEASKFYQNAGKAYQQVMNESPSATRVQAQLNNLSLQLDIEQNTKQLAKAQNVWDEINISDLPKGRNLVYAKINLAKSLACLQQKNNIPISSSLWNKIDNLLVTAIKDAREIQDPRAESYALGNRGGLYEYFAWQLRAQFQQKSTTKEYQNYIQTSQQLTQAALLLAQPIDAPDIAYQWQWQLGRLEVQEGKRDEAIKAYEAAVKTLKVVRSDLLDINSDVQFSFRDNVEPVYRELVDLLLKTEGIFNPKPENLNKAIEQLNFLQLAELENFLRCDLSQFVQIDKVADKEDQTSAVFYPIILEDRLEVILKLPNQLEPIYYHTLVVTVQGGKRAIASAQAVPS